jgi:hypothetical protein
MLRALARAGSRCKGAKIGETAEDAHRDGRRRLAERARREHQTLRKAAVSREDLRGQGQPVFTAMAAFTADSMETALDRYDGTLRHLREARDLAERAGGDNLAVGSKTTTCPGASQ